MRNPIRDPESFRPWIQHVRKRAPYDFTFFRLNFFSQPVGILLQFVFYEHFEPAIFVVFGWYTKCSTSVFFRFFFLEVLLILKPQTTVIAEFQKIKVFLWIAASFCGQIAGSLKVKMSQEKRSLGPEGYSIVSMANLNLKRFIKYKEKRPGLRKWAKKATIPLVIHTENFLSFVMYISVFFLQKWLCWLSERW